MRNSKIITMSLIILFAVNVGAEVQIDFDGVGITESESFQRTIREKKSDMPVPKLSASVKNDDNSASYISANRSIINIIRRCEKKREDSFINDSLKKLLAFGTFNEKVAFIQDKTYIFPKRFNKLKLDESLQSIIERSQIQVCNEENCRDEEICGFKEVCTLVSDMVCGAATSGGGALIGGGLPGAVIGGAVGGTTCHYVTKEVCKNVKNCNTVVNCDTVCH